jgi:hypothetical protein
MLINIVVYNPHANHNNPALVPEVGPRKAPTTTPNEPTDPASRKKIEADPELTKKIPLLPLPAAFPRVMLQLLLQVLPKALSSRSAPLKQIRQPSSRKRRFSKKL